MSVLQGPVTVAAASAGSTVVSADLTYNANGVVQITSPPPPTPLPNVQVQLYDGILGQWTPVEGGAGFSGFLAYDMSQAGLLMKDLSQVAYQALNTQTPPGPRYFSKARVVYQNNAATGVALTVTVNSR
jgi:hypothetical protein